MKGLAYHAEEFELYSEGTGKSLKGFEQESKL